MGHRADPRSLEPGENVPLLGTCADPAIIRARTSARCHCPPPSCLLPAAARQAPEATNGNSPTQGLGTSLGKRSWNSHCEKVQHLREGRPVQLRDGFATGSGDGVATCFRNRLASRGSMWLLSHGRTAGPGERCHAAALRGSRQQPGHGAEGPGVEGRGAILKDGASGRSDV